MRDTLEVYAYLHGQKHGLTTVTRTDTIVGKIDLPTNLIEFSTAKEKGPGWILLRLPRFLANEYALVKIGSAVDNVERLNLDALARDLGADKAELSGNSLTLATAPLKEGLARPKTLLTPKRPGSSNHILADAKAKSITQQLADASLDIV